MKIVFIGTPAFAATALKELANKYKVSLVVTRESKPRGRSKKLIDPEVKVVADELNISVIQPKSINAPDVVERLKSENADIFVVAAYGQIIKKEILDIPKYIVNIHASLLPKYRGAAPINRAIIDGEKETGISIMKVEEGLDTGDVALVEKVEIGDKNAEVLERELAQIGARLICDFVELAKENKVVFTPQDDAQSTYAEKISKETGKIDFEKLTAREGLNLIRGLYPSPGAFATLNENNYKFFEGEVVKGTGKPGEVLSSNKELIIAFKEDALSVKEIQAPGKKRMDIKSFLLGNKIERGEVFK